MKIFGTMYDSTTPHVIPSGARLVALYINGRFAVPPSYHKGHVYIDVNGSMPNAASILDVEQFDARPEQVGPWLVKRAAFDVGTIYCNRSTLPAVIKSAGHLKFNLWLATLDGSLPEVHLPPNGRLVAIQQFGSDHLHFNADLSVVVDEDWWRRHAR